ncbi:alpha/beta hydrolase [Streptomyces sp. NBC_01142]|uniref:alpha/beta hydrolase n=1 Tax=Streptomyces sp. NBC_01142 TaxID=2975865 RepID=UPI00338DA458
MYRKSHRRKAAEDFRDWADDVAPSGLQTVFAHSYGGEVAARAIRNGTRLRELVLLSAPATRHVKAAAATSGLRVVDVRLRFDPVLVLARTRQKIQHPNVTPVVLRDWRLGHSATHKRHVWLKEDVARLGQI